MKKLAPLIIGLYFIVFLTNCSTIGYLVIKPNKTSIKQLFDWAILEADIYSWKGQNKSAVVRSWGNPNSHVYISNSEEQIEYSISEVIVTTTATTSGTFYVVTNSTDNKIKSSAKETISKISFYIIDGEISNVSYSGYYSTLKQLCKSSADKSETSNKIKKNYYTLLALSGNGYITWSDVSTDNLYSILLPLSKNYHKSTELLKYYEETAKNIFNMKEFNTLKKASTHLTIIENSINRGVFHENTWDIITDINNNYTIEQYLANIKVYRELFENEKNESTETLSTKSRYTLEDFTSGRIKWNEVPYEDLKNLVQFSESSLALVDFDFKAEARKNTASFNSKQQYIDSIDFLITNNILDSHTIDIWLAFIECYYNAYPDELKKQEGIDNYDVIQ